jgi:hypothetical protein
MLFDHLTRHAIHDFRSFSGLCGGPYSPQSVDKLVRSYQPPALYANLKDARGAIAPSIFLHLLSLHKTRLTIVPIELFRLSREGSLHNSRIRTHAPAPT